ncbi:multidrug resistance protein, MATE family [Desulfuromusa kysingii]|uniref:Multidrug-efflux transporter n=1 Tax=Desulfuromusa kysingii TaxID=37625 RepID=A0A1H4C9B8_9BACT|nr:MATE family efflux transporter [Desulfuromusa kysingii]SEA56899.1 multidrug resistance protein, MATE family [Desulfuromusa kysingii]
MSHFKRRQFKLLRTEAGLLLPLAAPILAAQLAQQALAFTDTVMAGRVSTADLAGVAVGGSIWGPLFLFLYGVLLAITPMVAQLYGAGKIAETGPLARRGALVSIPLVLIIILLLRNASIIFYPMGVEPQVAVIAANYLKAISWGVPAVTLFFLLRNLSEGLGLARPSMLIGLASIPVNVVGNYLFIYGKFGFPAMGGVGCGWASALSLWFMCGCMLLTIWRVRRYNMTHFFDLGKKCGVEGAAQFIRLGLPIGVSLLVEASIFALIALFLSPLGAMTVASHQITLNYSSLIFMIPLSLSSAITIRVGHAIGRQRFDRARLVSVAGISLNSLIALFTATLTMVFARNIAEIYTHDPEVIAIAVGLLYLNALYQFSDAFQVGAAAALRGYKDTRVPLLMVVVAYWVIGLPLGYSLALTNVFGSPMGAKGFWLSLLIGLSVAAVLLGLRLRKVSRKDVILAEG